MTGDAGTSSFWHGKRVFLTGHTGFKGSWLALYLSGLGADVHGLSLAPENTPSLFEEARIVEVLAGHELGDIRDADLVRRAMAAAQPDIIMHLAAQPLVRRSFRMPLETYATNVMGTAHVLEAARGIDHLGAIVCVTSDKCYENQEWLWGYRENEAMGGYDPYSSSKGCAELVASAYRRSFLAEANVGLATARAGNVIGGGDWSEDRLVPDFLRALDRQETLTIRYPNAIRPWQHVMESVAGYSLLAERLYHARETFAEGWNFGPDASDAKTVRWIVEKLCARRPDLQWQMMNKDQPHEANFLRLDSSKALARLDWRRRYDAQQALDLTLDWHLAWRDGADAQACTRGQLDQYVAGLD